MNYPTAISRVSSTILLIYAASGGVFVPSCAIKIDGFTMIILRNTFLCLAFLPLSIAFASQPEDKIASDNDTAISQSAEQDDSIEKKTPKAAAKSSPWLITPIFSSDPKMATSLGVFVAYVHHFDEQSPASTFGGTGNYSSTDSYNYGVFARTYFGEDYHRLSAGAFKAMGTDNDYWTSTPYDNKGNVEGVLHGLLNSQSSTVRNFHVPGYGFCIRCVRDEAVQVKNQISLPGSNVFPNPAGDQLKVRNADGNHLTI